MGPSVDGCCVPFRIKCSEVVIGPGEGYLCLPAIMPFASLATDTTVRILVDVAFLLATGARCLARITK